MGEAGCAAGPQAFACAQDPHLLALRAVGARDGARSKCSTRRPTRSGLSFRPNSARTRGPSSFKNMNEAGGWETPEEGQLLNKISLAESNTARMAGRQTSS